MANIESPRRMRIAAPDRCACKSTARRKPNYAECDLRESRGGPQLLPRGPHNRRLRITAVDDDARARHVCLYRVAIKLHLMQLAVATSLGWIRTKRNAVTP